RSGRHTQKDNQMVVVIDGVNTKEEADKLSGKTATWKSPAGKEIKGEVRAAHGNSGAVRVVFEKGMPGQSITTKVSIQ
ncbi:50S ribosomal protein L35ae, partial [Candidatus Woesearchaeota archaeon]|nr:50S ribosomal protein L35ae [Candidatus Woesearchaeota archaeon]